MVTTKLSIAQSLNVETPRQSTMDTTPKEVGEHGTFLNVRVEKIDFFEKNPRKHRDDESYEQIKASIRATGVQHPVHITQRPNSDRFVLAQGGNTRLSIMKELYAETGEERFAVLPCIYVKYTNETDIQIAHLIENEQRQEMCFWDKAQAYSEVRNILSKDKKIPLRETVILFSECGLSVSQGLLAFLFFANDKLQPLGKLAERLSTPKTTKISKTYNDLKKRCKDDGKSEQDFEDWFVIALRDFAQYSESATELDTELLLNHLEKSFSDYFDIQTADLFEDEYLPDTENTRQPESTLSGNHSEQEIATDNAPQERFNNGSGVSRKEETPKPKEYSYGVPEPVNNDNKEDTATTDTPLPESPLSGSHNVQDTATVYETYQDWQKEVHQRVKDVLNICYLGKCFVESDLFPLGFYIEYPDFELLRKTIVEVRKGVMTIDYLHPEAGNIWLMLSVVSGQVDYIYNYDGNDNPILKLSDKSKVKQQLTNLDVQDKLKYELIGDFEFKPFLSDKIIRLFSNATGDKLSRAVQKLFQTMQLKPYIEGNE